MKRFLGLYLLAPLITLINVSGAQEMDSVAQQRYHTSHFLSAGAGWGGQGMAVNALWTSELKNGRCFSVGANAAFEFSIFGTPHSVDAESFFLEIGRIHKRKNGLLKLTWGLTYTHVLRRGSSGPPAFIFPTYETTHRYTVGLQGDLQLIPARGLAGIGVNLFLNLNPRFVYGGIVFQGVLGRVHYLRKI